MLSRRTAAVSVAALALLSACRGALDQRAKAQNEAFAVFDPATNQIPLPNDLALKAPPFVAAAAADACGTLPDLNSQLVCAFVKAGGFPYDQEVPITVRFQAQSVTGDGTVATDPVVLDTTTIRALGAAPAPTVAVFDLTAMAPVLGVEASFAAGTGTLTLRRPQAGADVTTRRWTAGHRYAAFVLGGPAGVKTADGAEVEPMPTMFVLREAILANADLTVPENQTLIPGTPEQKAAAGAQLEQIRRGYAPLRGAFEAAFGAGSFANMIDLLTFQVAPARTVVALDPDRSLAPIPIDLLRAPDAAGGLVLDNPAYGAARAGMVTLDGFSTTAPITAGLAYGSDPAAVASVDASTVNGANVFLYALGGGTATRLAELRAEIAAARAGAADANPAAARYVAQPDGTFVPAAIATCPIAGGCASTLVLQPAVPAVAAGAYLPPLEGGTKYAVIVTSRVKDVGGNPLGRTTAARLLLDLSVPITSALAGASAPALQQMRDDLAPVWSQLPAGTTRADVAMAYVFRTQTVTGPSLQLSAAPYGIERGAGAAVFNPAYAASVTASYPLVAGADAIYRMVVPSVDVTSKATGALDPAVLGSSTLVLSHVTGLPALVAVPLAANVPFCSGTSGPRCAPLVVFGHGLGGSKESLLVPSAGASPPVNALLAKGYVVAAIDFPQHGERTWCFSSADCDLSAPGAGDGTCTPFAAGVAPGYQGDVDPGTGLPVNPGVCTGGSTPSPARSGQTFISANFFRTRDALRQNLLDQAALVLALARPPGFPTAAAYAAATTASPLTAALSAAGIYAVNPARVLWEGISLGGIAGTEVLATNPRFGRGVTSVAGGTMVDFFTASPAFRAQTDALFTALLAVPLAGRAFDPGLVTPGPTYDPAVAAAYGKTLLLAKWILDPGDPLNFARSLRIAPLPDLLTDPTGRTPQPAKQVLGQIATGDQVIPNDFNRELFSNGAVDVVTYTSSSPPGYPASAMHGVLGFDPTVQADAAAYLDALTVPASPASIP